MDGYTPDRIEMLLPDACRHSVLDYVVEISYSIDEHGYMASVYYSDDGSIAPRGVLVMRGSHPTDPVALIRNIYARLGQCHS